ncbi:efflux RND transporter periplasmic adaptor subunit [Carboxydothermus hydrogenoformans]|uniref:Efflux transporter, RND family, MFP subunit n=1 Tax=Carboxydothermus hydrogenoformans (strain ATCC BAA-161 / DSM 6008 / Z-2901) TaxID=246194 RepID=Q3A9Y4_CARHZ|nr:efflux RND transporter periplasmic adaptor subunit [Carboxydothermus hydrogenoformans]ABB16128.1 efflux transporter, RND family, MFP subunit [Carboxydothermus hydrogenoformans Z-2901]
MKKKILAIVVIVLFIGGVAGLNVVKIKKNPGIAVKTTKVAEGDIVKYAFAEGTIEPKTTENIYVYTPGTVKEVLVKPGQKVKAGQVVLKLDDTELKNQLKEAENQVELLEVQLSDAKKAEKLPGMNQTSTKSLEVQLKSARDRVEMLKEKIAQTQLKTKLSGVVLAVNVEAGQTANPGVPVIVVGDLSGFKVKGRVNQFDAALISPGQKFTAQAEGLEREYTGIIETVEPQAVKTVSAQGEEIKVGFNGKITGDITGLKPGYKVDLKIEAGRKNGVLTLPLETIVERDTKKYVFIVVGDKVKLQEVKLGLSDDLKAQVLSGVKKGDLVVVNPPAELKDGDKVKVK